MTQIIIIAAVADNGVIGAKNDIPWRISEDFKRFKRLTLGHPCIMGDATYESLPSRPLPGRENIVLTLNRDYRPPGVTLFHDFDEAIAYVRGKGEEKAFITGGATIYRLALKVADILDLTRVHREFAGDVRFPEIDSNEWERFFEETHEGIDGKSQQPLRFTHETYRRRAEGTGVSK
jgi:dihydrofolate reductase